MIRAMELLLAYAAGLLTLINPCVLPVLPIVLASGLQAGRAGPLALAAGMSLSFVALGVGITAFGQALGIYPETIARIGAALMIGFGAALLLPRAQGVLAGATAGLSARADARMDGLDLSGPGGQFAGGVLLGAVWSPCIGPTLGAAIALASQGEALGRVTLIMTAFALGVSTFMLAIAYGTRGALQRHGATLRRIAAAARPALGLVFIATGLAVLLGLHHLAEGWLLSVMPDWLIDLSVTF